MRKIEIARKLARMNEKADAINAYRLALQEELEPVEQLEAAAYILQNGGNYKVSYTTFVNLYNQGHFREDILPLVEKVFYEPNIRMLRGRYERNCKLLKKYPYFFREDFIPFEDLPIRFFPYDDDHGYVPYFVDEARFGGYVNVKNTVISRNFFKDLEKPILAEDVYSQYELEYLRDNVRRSEDVARENHIYLHYTDWPVFCSYLACLNWRPLLEERKLVFLFGEELSRYPIDFKEEFGIDYSRLTLQPVRVREITKLVWHTQLSTHNGGDFFNEIFDFHPNLLCLPSIMLSTVEEAVKDAGEIFGKANTLREAMQKVTGWPRQVVEEVYRNRNRSDKDIFVAMFMDNEMATAGWDRASRIAPAVFFQPHFPNMSFSLDIDEKDRAVLWAENYETIRTSPIFQGFKYIKTFTPMRRITTSHGASVKFMYQSAQEKNRTWDSITDEEEKVRSAVDDAVIERVLNRSFMIDPQDRLYRDSVLVRFEDGKLNPTATFTALAAFLDLPYTESLTYCSEYGKSEYGNSESSKEIERVYGTRIYGFDTATLYRTYDDYVNDSERKFIEYFFRDAYEYYGYDFHYYDGGPVDEEEVKRWLEGFDTIDSYIRKTMKIVYDEANILNEKDLQLIADSGGEIDTDPAEAEADREARLERARQSVRDQLLEQHMDKVRETRVKNTEILMRGLRFINKNGQPLYMMPKLKLDPDLLEQPLYH